jgi:hypothetical protein
MPPAQEGNSGREVDAEAACAENVESCCFRCSEEQLGQ